MNVKGEKPEEIVASDEHIESQKPPVNEYADVTGEIVLPENRKKKKKFRKKPFDKNQQRPQQ
ncbi:MAG: hypothetical protein IPL42_12720 [Saprospiraceae bacterium]|nr:hypothetical protein [Saprospiraceae bacterium]